MFMRSLGFTLCASSTSEKYISARQYAFFRGTQWLELRSSTSGPLGLQKVQNMDVAKGSERTLSRATGLRAAN